MRGKRGHGAAAPARSCHPAPRPGPFSPSGYILLTRAGPRRDPGVGRSHLVTSCSQGAPKSSAGYELVTVWGTTWNHCVTSPCQAHSRSIRCLATVDDPPEDGALQTTSPEGGQGGTVRHEPLQQL